MPDEAAGLTELVVRSKAHWGYDGAFMARVRPSLQLSAEYVRRECVYLAEVAGKVAGMYALEGVPPEAELAYLFVDPPYIGRGVGKALFQHSLALARSEGFCRVLVEADPNAEPFYQALGGRRVGERPSAAVAGRVLPLLSLDLEPPPPRQ